MRITVLFGFILVTVLMLIVGAISLHQVRSYQDSQTAIVKVNIAKLELAHKMRESIRLRQISMNSMLIMDDPFQRDEELVQFYQYAGLYRKAHEILHTLPLNKKELDIHDQLTRQVQIAQPLNREAVELIQTGEINKSKHVISLAQRAQSKLLDTLDTLVNLQTSHAENVVNKGQQDFDNTIYLILIFGVIAAIFTLGTGLVVSRFVVNKNNELMVKNNELAKAYETAEAATRSKSAFLATMSHEIRTPMTAILGFAETTLHSSQTEEERHQALTTVIRCGQHLLQIINDILDLSKVEANQLNIEKVSTSPFQCLSEIEPIIRPRAIQKGLVFGINYQFPLPEEIIADPFRLKQIILNLCSNAIKFTEQGHIHINVSYDEDNHELSYEVVDTGIGMTEEQQRVVFEPFKQADSTTTRKYGGTGLGLSLSRQLAEKMGGTLSVSSKPSTGSRFKLTINTGLESTANLVFSESIKHYDLPKHLTPLPKNVVSGSILLAEDNPDNQKLISLYLTQMGADVTIAENGQSAVEQASWKKFDLILMDMHMPVMNGIDATKIIREQNVKTPIVALTANVTAEDREQCQAAGCEGFLAKPIDREKFFKVVTNYLAENRNADNSEKPIFSPLLDESSSFTDIVKQFVSNLPGHINAIKEELANEGYQQLDEIVHNLKGSSANLGYEEVYEVTSKLEFHIANKNKNEINTLIFELEKLHKRLIDGLKNKHIKIINNHSS